MSMSGRKKEGKWNGEKKERKQFSFIFCYRLSIYHISSVLFSRFLPLSVSPFVPNIQPLYCGVTTFSYICIFILYQSQYGISVLMEHNPLDLICK